MCQLKYLMSHDKYALTIALGFFPLLLPLAYREVENFFSCRNLVDSVSINLMPLYEQFSRISCLVNPFSLLFYFQ